MWPERTYRFHGATPTAGTGATMAGSFRNPEMKKRVAIVGSGNWGCAIAKIVGNNATRHNHLEDEVAPPAFPTQQRPHSAGTHSTK